MSIFRRALALLLVLVILGAAAVGVYAWRSLPQTEGRATVAGLHAEVQIWRTARGVPHIFASAAPDAYFALGYAHAQDRLWQMEMNRRMANGTLAQVLGAKALPSDTLMRTLDLHGIAERNLAHFDARTRGVLDAYSQGINAYLAEHPVLPPEFVLAGFRPQPWQPADSVAFFRLMAWRMAGNLWDELATAELSTRFTPREVAELIPAYPGDQRPPLPDLTALYAENAPAWPQLLAALPERQPVGIGSNNWALSGKRTASGAPLLANDPHLMLAAPSLWYFAHLQAPGLDVIGATLPGMPGIILGRNQNVAWSFTNTHSDVMDLFIEKTLPGDASRYATPDGSAAFALRTERIAVKGAADTVLQVRSTRHGPVLSDVMERAGQLARTGQVVALQWVGLRDDDLSLQFPLEAAEANNGEGLRQASSDFHSPQQNIVYADRDGQIGFIAAGRVPVRRADNDLQGRAPAPGWDARYDWQGLIPFAELPQQVDPVNGELITANQKITASDYPYWLTSNWVLPYRVQRIHQVLNGLPKATAKDFTGLQMDVENPVAQQLLPLLLKPLQAPSGSAASGVAANAVAASAVALLRNWDGQMRSERPEPLIYAEWLRLFSESLYAARLGDLYEQVGEHNPAFLSALLSDRDGAARWCHAVVKTAPDGLAACASLVNASFASAVENLRQRYGADPTQWRWGQAHAALSQHLVFGGIPLLGRLFNVSIANGGGRDTVNYAGYYYDPASGKYLDDVAPGFRAVYDLAADGASSFILSTGQSGNPFSSHYRDQLEDWAAGRMLPMTTDRAALQRENPQRLSLQPAFQ